MTHPPKNRSLQAKSNARLVAVQLLYRGQLLEEPVRADILLKRVKTIDIKGEKPHRPTLTMLLEGIAEHGQALDRVIEKHFSDEWKKERMNPLALIILRLGALELDTNRSLAEQVIIDEYTTLAAQFLAEEEIGFVHGLLGNLAQEMR